jgi:hypothetical protein
MSYIYGNKLLEYVIRVGTNDILNDPTILNYMFESDPLTNLGSDLTAPNATTKTLEKLPTDKFIEKLNATQRTKDETVSSTVFRNSIPTIPDIAAYLQNANMNLKHGFPREAQDLPCIAITLAGEDEGEKYLGSIKFQSVLSNGNKYDFMGSDWSTQYHMNIITPNYDETEVWYFILKYCFITYRAVLEAYGLREQNLSFADLEPAAEYLQGGLFMYQRTAIFSCKKNEAVPVQSAGQFNSFQFQEATPDGFVSNSSGSLPNDGT